MMMSRQVLVLGATGMLGQPVAHCLADKGHRVRILVRSAGKARQMFGNAVEIVDGSAVNQDTIRAAMVGCDAVHINLWLRFEPFGALTFCVWLRLFASGYTPNLPKTFPRQIPERRWDTRGRYVWSLAAAGSAKRAAPKRTALLMHIETTMIGS